jgi:signal transduction histidine kinase
VIRLPSIRARLICGTTAAMALILAGCGIVFYTSVRAALYREFDLASAAKAKALASMVEFQHDGVLRMEFDPARMPEFSRALRPEYFECWNSDGVVLFRSESLGDDKAVAARPLVQVGSAKEPVVLPDGHQGRQAEMIFQPAAEDHEDAARAAAAKPVRFAVARGTAEIDHRLAELMGLLLSICGGAIVCSAAILAWIVRRGLSPLETVAAKISALPGHNLSDRIQLTEQPPRELEPVVARLNDLLERLEAAFVREKSFASDVAHELRTPLAGLETSLEVCASRPRSAGEYEQVVSRCLHVTRQMHAMVDNLLALARAEAGQLKLAREEVDFQLLLDECWALLADRARRRGLHAEWQFAAPNSILSADREKLRLVLNNLLDNAICYSDQGGNVQARGWIAGGEFHFQLTNTGCRLTSEEVEHVFDRFWRGDTARTQSGLHCGLGLTLVRRLVELMSGTISARLLEGGKFQTNLMLPDVAIRAQDDAVVTTWA